LADTIQSACKANTGFAHISCCIGNCIVDG
jgi:hypothetical protein